MLLKNPSQFDNFKAAHANKISNPWVSVETLSKTPTTVTTRFIVNSKNCGTDWCNYAVVWAATETLKEGNFSYQHELAQHRDIDVNPFPIPNGDRTELKNPGMMFLRMLTKNPNGLKKFQHQHTGQISNLKILVDVLSETNTSRVTRFVVTSQDCTTNNSCSKTVTWTTTETFTHNNESLGDYRENWDYVNLLK
jgi:hypothetical protein